MEEKLLNIEVFRRQESNIQNFCLKNISAVSFIVNMDRRFEVGEVVRLKFFIKEKNLNFSPLAKVIFLYERPLLQDKYQIIFELFDLEYQDAKLFELFVLGNDLISMN